MTLDLVAKDAHSTLVEGVTDVDVGVEESIVEDCQFGISCLEAAWSQQIFSFKLVAVSKSVTLAKALNP